MKVKEMNETINGVRNNLQPKADSFLKAKSEKTFENSSHKDFTEKIYEIEDLSVADKSFIKSANKADETREKLRIIESRNRKSLFVNANFHSKSRRSELQTISPVIEETSKENKEDSDTASEVSDIPTDEDNDQSVRKCEGNKKEEEKTDISSLVHNDTVSTDHPDMVSSNNYVAETVESKTKESEQNDKSGLEKKPDQAGIKRDLHKSSPLHQNGPSYEYSSCEEESDSSSYSSNTSSYASSTSTSRAVTANSTKSGKVIDRLKEKRSPENSLFQPNLSKETKTTDKNTKEVTSDTTKLEEEIKEEFERKHKYISNKNYIIKKSPEDSGFESFQQSSVEQNSNQDSDEDNVIHTFDTVMEAENENSKRAEEKIAETLETDTLDSNNHMQELFERAEQARLNAKRFREQSSNQLGLHLVNVSYKSSVPEEIAEDADTKIVYKEPSSCQKDGFTESRCQGKERAIEMPKV